MHLLILIKNGCDNLTATASPSVDAVGLHMVLALATIMLVWFGVQEALASAQGGAGFNVGRFLSFFLLITFAYCFVKFYDSTIPGIGYSLKGFISGGTSSLVDYIGTEATQQMQNTIHAALNQAGTVWRQANVPVNDNQNSRLSVELVSSPVCAVDAGWAGA